MREVSFTRGFVALIDEGDATAVLGAGSWCANVQPGGLVYAVHAIKKADGRWTVQTMHSFLTGWSFVDHANGDALDNRRVNLRQAQKSTNGMNRGVPQNNTSGYKGVAWSKAARKWRAQIGINGEHRYLGVFQDPADAARAYDAAAIELHGPFARLNFPEVTT